MRPTALLSLAFILFTSSAYGQNSDDTTYGQLSGRGIAPSMLLGNTLYGAYTGLNLSSGGGFFNTYVGHGAGLSETSGHSNVAVGRSAGWRSDGASYNVFVGHGSAFYNTTGSYNTCVGDGTCNNADDPKQSNLSGSFTTYIGEAAGPKGPALDYSGGIGAYAYSACAHCFVIGGTGEHYTKVGIGTDTPTATLDVATGKVAIGRPNSPTCINGFSVGGVPLRIRFNDNGSLNSSPGSCDEPLD